MLQASAGEEINPAWTVESLPSSKHVTVFEVQDLYLFMGRELEHMDSVPVGNVLG